MRKILFVHNDPGRFVNWDLQKLQERYQVTEYCLHKRRMNPAAIWRQVRAHDLVFGWFASWHTFLPMFFARLLGKPSLLVSGGYDVANLPEIDYGHQRGGLKKWMGRWTMRLTSCLVTNSCFSRDEAGRNAGIPKERVHMVYHGVPDPFVSLPGEPRAHMVLTVGNVDRGNLWRKGHEPFVRAAAYLPDVTFVLIGAWKDDAINYLRAIAPPNVSFTGWVDDETLLDYYCKASVYVQPSRHEGFGLSVAEAMLSGCIPVVTQVGALPEVVGKCGIYLAAQDPASIAQAIEGALASNPEARLLARQRILEQFPMNRRGQSLDQLISSLI